jgi:tetratricopeptide (TPR) repeat protein
MGDAFSYQRKWSDAIGYYKKLIKVQKNNANYHYKYGGALAMKAFSVSKLRALTMIGDIKGAFLKAAKLDAKHIDTRWALVEFYVQLPGIFGGSIKKALFFADQLQQLSLVDGYLAKGYIYEYDDDPQLAEMYFKNAIEVGGSIKCYDKLSSLYESQNQPENAITVIEEAHDRHNTNSLNYQIGKVCADYNLQLDKGERCLMAYIKNYTAKDGVPLEWAYFRLAQIYKNRANKPEALRWINKALQTKKDFKQGIAEKNKILGL